MHAHLIQAYAYFITFNIFTVEIKMLPKVHILISSQINRKVSIAIFFTVPIPFPPSPSENRIEISQNLILNRTRAAIALLQVNYRL